MKFLASLVLGGVLGVAVGFSIYTIGAGNYALDFVHWVNRFNMFSGQRYYDAYYWAFGGAISAGAISLLLSKNSN